MHKTSNTVKLLQCFLNQIQQIYGNEPVPLDNDEMESVKAVLKRFPVLSYKITNMEFRTAVDNEIKCSFVMNDSLNITSSWTFRPMNYLGGWRLCLMK